MKYLIGMFSGIYFLALVVSPPAQSETFDTRQMKILTSDGLIFTVNIRRGLLEFNYKNNGDWTAEIDGEEAWGSWKLDGNKICREFDGPDEGWNRMRDGPSCFGIRREGERLYSTQSGHELALDDSSVLARLTGPNNDGGAPGSQLKQLKAAQLKALFTGGVTYDILKPNKLLTFSYSDDGTWRAANEKGKSIWGAWRIKDDSICRTFDGRDANWSLLREKPCMVLRQKGGVIFLGRSGNKLRFKDETVLTRLETGYKQTASKPEPQIRQPDTRQQQSLNTVVDATGAYNAAQIQYLISGLSGTSRNAEWCMEEYEFVINAEVELHFQSDSVFSFDAFCNKGPEGIIEQSGQGSWTVQRDSLCIKFQDNLSVPLGDCWRVTPSNSGFVLSEISGDKAWRLAFSQHPRHEAVGSLHVALQTGPTGIRNNGKPKVAPVQSPPDPEEQRLARERKRLSQSAAVEREKIDAERRELERMRIEFEKEKLRQQRALLQKQRLALQSKAVAPKPVARDTTAPVIHAPRLLKTKAAKFVVKGAVKDDSKIIRVEVNGKSIPFSAKDGAFAANAEISIGRNDVRIAAFDTHGNKSEHVVAVTRTRDIPNIAYGAYHALVIGINDYKSLPKLNTALADARAVAKSLKKRYGFSVMLLENPNRGDIIDAFDEMREKLDVDDNLLIYYAGHGWLDPQSKRGYWLPVDAKSDRRSRWLSNSDLTDALQAILAKHVMVVADSCYSGTLTRSIKVPQRNPAYIKRMAEKRARVVLSSGGLEPVADSGGGDHSVFAAQFLNALNENNAIMDGTQLFEAVRHKVVLNAQQTPEYSDIRLAGHEGGDFLFVRKD